VVHWGTVVGPGLEVERFVEVQVPNTPTALGKDLAGAAVLDQWIDAVGTANMSDVHCPVCSDISVNIEFFGGTPASSKSRKPLNPHLYSDRPSLRPYNRYPVSDPPADIQCRTL